MLTGVQAFGGDDVGNVLANVIKGEPDWSALPGDTPRSLRVCLRRCLQKDPARRFHHAADLRLAMEGAFEVAAGDGHPTTPSRRSPAWAASAGWVVAALVTVGSAMVAVMTFLRTPAESPRTGVGIATPPVLVSLQASGGGGAATAKTIQEAINLAAPGSTVSVLPGTYAESLTITKGLTLEATGERSGPVIVAPAGTPESTIEITATDPVTIRGLTIHVPGANGIRGTGGVDLTVDRSTILAVNPPSGRSALVMVSNDTKASGARARMAVRRSMMDGTITRLPRGVPRPRSHAVHLVGDLDAVLEGNMIRRTGGICIVVDTRGDFGGVTNVDILTNDIDECHPVAPVAAIKVGSPPVAQLSPKQPITATGIVNIVGNAIRNSSQDCVISAIAYDVFGGRIERNRIIDFVQPCAVATPRNHPAAIWLGLRVTGILVPPVTPTVRLNDIQGNAHAGFRVGPTQTIPSDVSCNYWGSPQGPSGIGQGPGDAILVEAGAPAPVFRPFATAPIATSSKTGC